MTSSYSPTLRLNYQESGDNLNTWGLVLNSGVFQLLEDAITKRVAFSLSGSKTLTTANGATDEARAAFLDVTSGTGGTITIPSVAKLYVVRNGASGTVTISTGAGTSAALAAGEVLFVACDGGNVYRVQPTRISVTPTATDSIVNKAYVDALAFDAVNLPDQAGNAGAYLTTNGTNASWAQIQGSDVHNLTVSSITDYVSDQTSRHTAMQGEWEDFAVAMALTL